MKLLVQIHRNTALDVPAPQTVLIPLSVGRLGCCMLHLSVSPAVPQAGATTPRNTILLQVVLREVTRCVRRRLSFPESLREGILGD